MYIIFYTSRSSDLKECFLRSDRANHKNRPTPLICHINKSKAFSDAAMGTVRAHPTSVVKICPLGRLMIANVTIIIMSSCHAMLLSYFVINIKIKTYSQCLSDPSSCAALGNTNIFGYPAHFDLQNANLQVGASDF